MDMVEEENVYSFIYGSVKELKFYYSQRDSSPEYVIINYWESFFGNSAYVVKLDRPLKIIMLDNTQEEWEITVRRIVKNDKSDNPDEQD